MIVLEHKKGATGQRLPAYILQQQWPLSLRDLGRLFLFCIQVFAKRIAEAKAGDAKGQ